MSKKMIELPCDRCIHSKVCSRKGAYSKDGVCEYFDEKRQQGEWVEKIETKQFGYGWLTSHETVCSICGGSGESDEGIPQCWKFCPNCGADMMKGGAE